MISVSIWRKALVANHACAEGLALFDAIAAQQSESDPRRLHRIRIPRWTTLHWIMLVQAGFGEWCASRNIVPRADLYGADLTRTDLTCAALTRTDLAHANLNGAALTRADLYGANLTRTDLTHADLTCADLTHANLYGANLSGANLTGANLTGAYRGHDQPPIPGWRVSAAGYLGRVL